MNMSARRLVVPGLALVGGVLLACSSSSPSSSSTSTSTQGNTAKLTTQARVMQTTPLTVTSSSVTFPANAESQALQTGHVIVSATRTDHPYLGTITSVQQSGGQVVAQITQASLTDLFDEIHWAQTVHMGDADSADGTASLRPGDGLHLNGLTGPASLPQKEWDLGNDGSGGVLQAGGDCKVDWSESYLKFGGGVEFNMDYSVLSGVSSLKLAALGNMTAHVGAKVTVEASTNYTSPDHEWWKGQIAVFWFTVGVVPVPVVFYVELTQNGNVEIDADLNLHTGVTLNASIEEGVQYANGAFSVVNNPKYSVSLDPPLTVTGKSASISFTEYPMNVVFSLQPFSVGGPTIEFDPFLRITGTYGTEGGEIDGSLGIESEVGGEVEILSHKLGSFAWPLGEWSHDWELWKSGEDAGGPEGGVDASADASSEAGSYYADSGASDSSYYACGDASSCDSGSYYGDASPSDSGSYYGDSTVTSDSGYYGGGDSGPVTDSGYYGGGDSGPVTDSGYYGGGDSSTPSDSGYYGGDDSSTPSDSGNGDGASSDSGYYQGGDATSATVRAATVSASKTRRAPR